MDISRPINLGMCQLLGPVLNKTTTICIKRLSNRSTVCSVSRQNFLPNGTQPLSSLQAGMSSNLVFPVLPQSPNPRLVPKDDRLQRVSMRKQVRKRGAYASRYRSVTLILKISHHTPATASSKPSTRQRSCILWLRRFGCYGYNG